MRLTILLEGNLSCASFEVIVINTMSLLLLINTKVFGKPVIERQRSTVGTVELKSSSVGLKK